MSILDLSPERWALIESLLERAESLDASQKLDSLREWCEGDEELFAQVKALLGKETDTFLESPVTALGNESLWQNLDKQFDNMVGRVIGGYRIEKEIGRGGMGAVYLAERADGEFEQTVALKVIKRGMDTDDIIRRFRYERQILARLHHPNIAQLFDGGVTDEGLPFIVMEYVQGIPIDEYARKQKLSVSARLALFQPVCEAVQYAHRNLIVHRDLKPGNILVSDEGRVKLLDFGIAKILEEEQDATVPVTREAGRRLTPEYAAPEQIRGDRVTPSTDVYALGVILYELLTGRRPYSFPSRMLKDIEKVVTESDPSRPSTIVIGKMGPDSQSTDSSLSSERKSTPQNLKKILRGDLDAITLMALRKDPDRRYSSAAELSVDIGSYLKGRPVLAQPDSFSYRAKKFVARNTLLVGAAALIFVTLLGAIVAVSNKATEARLSAEEAQQNADRAITTKEFVVNTFLSISPDSVNSIPGYVSTADLLNQAGENLSEIKDSLDFADIAVVVAELARVLGGAEQFAMADSLLEDAIGIGTNAYGKKDIRIAEALTAMTQLKLDMEQATEMDSLANWLMSVYPDSLKDTEGYLQAAILKSTASIWNHRAEESRNLLDQILTKENISPRHRALALQADALYQMNYNIADKAAIEASVGNYLESDFRGNLRVTEEAKGWHNSGQLYSLVDECKKSLDAFDRAIGQYKSIYGLENRLTIASMNGKALTLARCGRTEEAMTLADDVDALYSAMGQQFWSRYVHYARSLAHLRNADFPNALSSAQEYLGNPKVKKYIRHMEDNFLPSGSTLDVMYFEARARDGLCNVAAADSIIARLDSVVTRRGGIAFARFGFVEELDLYRQNRSSCH